MKDIQIVIFDDGSTDGSAEAIAAQFPLVKVIRGPGHYWWSRSMNEGLRLILKQANYDDFVLTLNNDTTFGPNFVELLFKRALRQKNTIVGSVNECTLNDTTQISKGFQVNARTGDVQIRERDDELLDSLPGRGTLVPIAAFKAVGLFAESWLPHYMADAEFFLRAKRAGFHLTVEDFAIIRETEDRTHKFSRYDSGWFSQWQNLFHIGSPNLLKGRAYIIAHHNPTMDKKLVGLLGLLGRSAKKLIPLNG